jgi:hypothetical protein
MCEVVRDFGNEHEMRALYKRQRGLIPVLRISALGFAALSVVLGWHRLAGKGQPSDDIDLLCAATSVLFTLCAEWNARTTFEQWIKNMPQVPRISGD